MYAQGLTFFISADREMELRTRNRTTVWSTRNRWFSKQQISRNSCRCSKELFNLMCTSPLWRMFQIFWPWEFRIQLLATLSYFFLNPQIFRLFPNIENPSEAYCTDCIIHALHAGDLQLGLVKALCLWAQDYEVISTCCHGAINAFQFGPFFLWCW